MTVLSRSRVQKDPQQKAREECESHRSMYEECKGGKFLLKERRCRKLKEVWDNCYSSKLKQLMEETKKGKAQPNLSDAQI